MRNFIIQNSITIFLVIMTILSACNSTKKTFKSSVDKEFTTQPIKSMDIIKMADIEHLPASMKKYLLYAGVPGKSKPQNVHIIFDAQMYRKKGDAPMKANSVQFNFFENYTRIFRMKASKIFIPFRALHIYSNQEATFKVRVACLFNVVNIKGEALTKAETVTVLNDMCIFAPACLIDKRLSWKEIDSLSCEVTFENGKYKVSAILYFNEKGELINFVSNDRSALQDDGTLKQVKWSTPVSEYREINGYKIATKGETIWNYDEGNFTYGKFKLKTIQYNLSK